MIEGTFTDHEIIGSLDLLDHERGVGVNRRTKVEQEGIPIERRGEDVGNLNALKHSLNNEEALSELGKFGTSS